jgi:hypothetical protein
MQKEQICQSLGISQATLDNWVKNHIPEAKIFNEYNIEVIRDFVVTNNKLQKRANKKLSSLIEKNSQLLAYLSDTKWVTTWVIFVENNQDKDIIDNINNLALKRSGQVFDKSEQLDVIDEIIPSEVFALGIAYQIALNSGDKSGKGSYYTPKWLVEKRIQKSLKLGMSYLEPCVGSGFYSTTFALLYKETYGEWPSSTIHINDIDPIAVNIAFSDLISVGVPYDIIVKTSVDGLNIKTEQGFDFIATNPPYGIKNHYDDLTTSEIFAHFIHKCFTSYLNNGGTLDFILPVSFLNVKKHAEIRKFVLSETNVEEIVFEGKCFDNVYSDIISLTIKKESLSDNFEFKNKEQNKTVSQKYCLSSSDSMIVFIDNNDIQQQKVLLDIPHTYLETSRFALGIVTGDNKTFLSEVYQPGYKFILDGKCVKKGYIDESKGKWILDTPHKYQQKPDITLFNNKKIVYKFISNKITTAVDNKGTLTLNSANFFVLPNDSKLSEEYVSAILNSTVINDYYQVVFGNPIKVLKSNLQQIPVFIFEEEIRKQIEDYYKEGEFDRCDNLITYLVEQYT